jgi:hypothetical protein
VETKLMLIDVTTSELEICDSYIHLTVINLEFEFHNVRLTVS